MTALDWLTVALIAMGVAVYAFYWPRGKDADKPTEKR